MHVGTRGNISEEGKLAGSGEGKLKAGLELTAKLTLL